MIRKTETGQIGKSLGTNFTFQVENADPAYNGLAELTRTLAQMGSQPRGTGAVTSNMLE